MKKLVLCSLLALGAGGVFAADAAPTAADVQTNLNVVWTLLGGILVFVMQAGFALVETGFTRAKIAANMAVMMNSTPARSTWAKTWAHAVPTATPETQ